MGELSGVDKECLRGCVNHLLDNFPLDCIMKDVADVLKIRLTVAKKIHRECWRDMSLFYSYNKEYILDFYSDFKEAK